MCSWRRADRIFVMGVLAANTQREKRPNTQEEPQNHHQECELNDPRFQNDFAQVLSACVVRQRKCATAKHFTHDATTTVNMPAAPTTSAKKPSEPRRTPMQDQRARAPPQLTQKLRERASSEMNCFFTNHVGNQTQDFEKSTNSAHSLNPHFL